MYFEANQKLLQKEIAMLMALTSRTPTVDYTTHILLTATQSHVNLAATDGNISVKGKVPIECLAAEPGAALLPAKKLNAIIGELDNTTVRFDSEGDNWMKITQGDSESNIGGMPPENFPGREFPEKYTGFIPAGILKGHIDRTIYAVPRKEGVRIVPGLFVLVQTEDDTAWMQSAAIDGNQMPVVKSKLLTQPDLKVMIPHTALGDVVRLLPLEEMETGIVGIVVEGNHVYFKVGDREMSANLLAAQPPAYDAILAMTKDNNKIISLRTGDFIKAIRRTHVLSDGKSKKILISAVSGKLYVHTETAAGKAKNPIETEFAEEIGPIGLNAEYLLNALNVMKSEQVRLEIKDEKTAVLLRPVADGDFNWVFLVMPMQ